MEVLLTTLFVDAKTALASLETVFGAAREVEGLVLRLRWFIETVVAKAGLAVGKRQVKAVEAGCAVAVEVLSRPVEGDEL